MTAELLIEGWQAKGLRCPDHEVDFRKEDGNIYPITLLQMPNGTGKTTTLELLRATLSGKAFDWSEEEILEFRKPGSTEHDGLFLLKTKYNDKKITFELKFDFDEKRIQYATTRLPSGQKPGFEPPYDLKQFLCPEFVKLFVFDGELAHTLLNKNHTNAEAAVEELFQLPMLRGINSRVDDYWEMKIAGRTATAEQGLTRRKNRVKKLRELIAEKEEQRKKIINELTSIQGELEEKKMRFEEEMRGQERISERASEILSELQFAKASIKEKTGEIIGEMRNPYSLSTEFGKRLMGLKEGLDKVKLPESAAKEFFEELAEEDECLCARPIGQDEAKHILERAAQYLGTDDVALLNAIKSDISSFLGEDHAAYPAMLESALGDLLSLATDMERIKTRRDAIETEAAKQDPELEEVRERISKLKEREGRLKEALEPFEFEYDESRDDKDVHNPDELWKRLRVAEKQLAEVTDTISLKEKRDKLHNILKNAFKNARDRLSQQIVTEANARMEDLMPFNHIRINSVDKCLRLEGQSGASVGETLSVGYAFLSTLFNRSDYKLPFIVDSPANPIDHRVRSEVGKLLPRLAHQVIGFTITTEREGFLRYIEDVAGDGLQYITMFRKGDQALEALARDTEEFEESQDGIVVSGKGFFHSFYKEEE